MSERGIECPACGCRHFFVIKTNQHLNFIRRTRECRHCGQRIYTRELAEKNRADVPSEPESQT